MTSMKPCLIHYKWTYVLDPLSNLMLLLYTKDTKKKCHFINVIDVQFVELKMDLEKVVEEFSDENILIG